MDLSCLFFNKKILYWSARSSIWIVQKFVWSIFCDAVMKITPSSNVLLPFWKIIYQTAANCQMPILHQLLPVFFGGNMNWVDDLSVIIVCPRLTLACSMLLSSTANSTSFWFLPLALLHLFHSALSMLFRLFLHPIFRFEFSDLPLIWISFPLSVIETQIST